MKFFKKIKSSNFWVSMVSAVVLILQAVFNVDIKTEYLNQIIMGMLGVLVMTGIVSDSPNSETDNKQSLSMDSIAQNLAQIFTQTIANMETNILSIITQFENLKNSFTTQETVSNEHGQQEKNKDIEIVQNIENINNEAQHQNIDQSNVGCEEVNNTEQEVDGVLIEQSAVVQESKTSNLNVL